ncbi:hypothetical protein LZ318_09180 [Saccharopolyspora indica]|uniref:hypothetical protein n=1 Tax=Saccharopolyspora indica TaxID=1229659 RepID=UPI0022EB6DEB|nr:hypothetical protein [Saccharopolyspora indica]MDA3643471.1 hypothetical protein [Saccharopolyspora indica]
MAHDGFRVDMTALQGAEEGVQQAIAELGEMARWGMSAAAAQGMGLAEYVWDSAAHVGHQKLGAAIMAFGQVWDPGMRYLVEDGQAAVGALGEARAAYHQMDAQAAAELQKFGGR